MEQVTCFAEAGGQHVPGMARAVESLGLRACLAQSVMDSGEGLPASWAARTAEDCIQVAELNLVLIIINALRESMTRQSQSLFGLN